MKYNRTKLIIQAQKGDKIKYVFFWGHQPAKDGSITKSIFSQWWESPFSDGENIYKTAEHFMMAGKARLFKDEDHLEKILSADHPHEAKKLGRKVKNFDPKVWDENKYEIVKQANLLKFSQYEEYKNFLLNTNDRVIVEASPRDNIWGIGMSEKNENAYHPEKWKGENLLGFALMEVRDELRGE